MKIRLLQRFHTLFGQHQSAFPLADSTAPRPSHKPRKPLLDIMKLYEVNGGVIMAVV